MESFVMDDFLAPSMLDESAQFGPSPKVIISDNMLPGDARRPAVPFQTPAVMQTPAPARNQDGAGAGAAEGLQELRTQLETRFNELDDKINQLTRSVMARDGGDASAVAKSRPGSHSRPFASFSASGQPAVLSPQSLIILTPDQLDRVVEDRVSAKIVEYQRSFVEQNLVEMRLRTLENSISSISRSLTGLSHDGASSGPKTQPGTAEPAPQTREAISQDQLLRQLHGGQSPQNAPGPATRAFWDDGVKLSAQSPGYPAAAVAAGPGGGSGDHHQVESLGHSLRSSVQHSPAPAHNQSAITPSKTRSAAGDDDDALSPSSRAYDVISSIRRQTLGLSHSGQ